MTHLPLTTVTFPEPPLRTRDAHKLRGYFGDFFKEHSPLLHNHYDDGSLRYAYPLVQYKVINRVPTLVGLGEGAQLLVELFLKIRTLDIDGREYPILSKHINHQQATVEVGNALTKYRFETLWMPLNQANHVEYMNADEPTRQALLQRILQNNILAFLKGVGAYQPDLPRLMILLNVQSQTTTQFKNQTMLAFTGDFVVNATLPDGIGLGKSVARGFGSIVALQRC
ncbi:CRISPR-associated endonuclease Cas6 [Runella sp. SP2]|uniref:CRISPR-associated endonuclease Cas6 n=1 Tax=Runella sp. SP2 TaxID=2268026 RepID=UPI000F073A2B|nr:CRISPR-associated endonuclease Cas6 [Runella sp. SP2]AYQ36653.1 DNA repair protein [Runella sp. SP2]